MKVLDDKVKKDMNKEISTTMEAVETFIVEDTKRILEDQEINPGVKAENNWYRAKIVSEEGETDLEPERALEEVIEEHQDRAVLIEEWR